MFAPELGKIADVEVRAKQAIAHAAQRLHSTPEIVADSLEQLASLFKAIGLGDAVETAACPRAAHRVRALRADMADWSTAHFGESATLAELVLATADLTLSCFPTLIAEARGLTKNVLDLVRRWQTNLNLIAGTLTRPQWLLDGWEPICAIWESAERNDTGQLSALHDMVQQVPVVPKEVGEWIDNTMEVNATRVFRRFTELNRDWRTGAPYLDQVAQNESRR
ncbi:MAG: hypothetical protein JOZ05_12205, partial [Acetobacteraceae bacterium]|nr:hypothetical protein [Acetobacteraceae bacterium]